MIKIIMMMVVITATKTRTMMMMQRRVTVRTTHCKWNDVYLVAVSAEQVAA